MLRQRQGREGQLVAVRKVQRLQADNWAPAEVDNMKVHLPLVACQRLGAVPFLEGQLAAEGLLDRQAV